MRIILFSNLLQMIYLQDIKLKAVILEFIATAVETQPGLIELFLDLTYKDNKVHDSFIFNKIFHDHYKEFSCRPNLPCNTGLISYRCSRNH